MRRHPGVPGFHPQSSDDSEDEDREILDVYSLTASLPLLRRITSNHSVAANHADAHEELCDFICFLLRYFSGVDYDDFTDLMNVANKIRRAEMHRCWVDIEDIILKSDRLDNTMKLNQTTTSGAIGEIIGYLDKMKREIETLGETMRTEIKNFKELTEASDNKLARMEKIFAQQDTIYDLQKEDGRIRSDMKDLESRINTRLHEAITHVDTSYVENFVHEPLTAELFFRKSSSRISRK